MSIITDIISGAADITGKVLFADVLFFIPNIQLPFLIFWIILGAIFFTFKLNFVNVRYFSESFKIFLKKEAVDETGKTITSRSAFLGAISGCVGVGSIAGVAASVYYGGPGVVFWLLIGAFMCMPIRFAEVFLGHHFRRKDNEGNIVSYGPFAYIMQGLPTVGLGKYAGFMKVFFSVGLILTSFSATMGQVGPTTELISASFFNNSPIAAFLVALVLGIFTLFVVFGGLKRMSTVIEKMAVVMSLIYIVSIFIILAVNIKNIPSAVSLIISSAFQVKSIYGGAIGTLVVALTRIISMNEIGMGTTALLHGKSKNEDSVSEGLLAMAGPFVAILVFVALNSFAVIVSGSFNSGQNGVLMISHMFLSVSSILHMALILVIFLFAITTLIAWYFYVDTALKELKGGKIMAKIYPVFFLSFVLAASFIPFGVILKFTDVLGIVIIIPNILVLYALSGIVKKNLDKYKKM